MTTFFFYILRRSILIFKIFAKKVVILHRIFLIYIFLIYIYKIYVNIISINITTRGITKYITDKMIKNLFSYDFQDINEKLSVVYEKLN